MGIIRKRATQRAFHLLKEKFANGFLRAAPELPEEIPADAFRYKGFQSGRICGNLGGTTEMSSSQRHFYGRDGGFFYFIASPERQNAAFAQLSQKNLRLHGNTSSVFF